MATDNSVKGILATVSQELNQVNNKITTSISSNDLDDSKIQNWIDNLNQLIRKLDHMVENLEQMQH